jgi:hypothetical protein
MESNPRAALPLPYIWGNIQGWVQIVWGIAAVFLALAGLRIGRIWGKMYIVLFASAALYVLVGLHLHDSHSCYVLPSFDHSTVAFRPLTHCANPLLDFFFLLLSSPSQGFEAWLVKRSVVVKLFTDLWDKKK